jgi:hypothetical protein
LSDEIHGKDGWVFSLEETQPVAVAEDFHELADHVAEMVTAVPADRGFSDQLNVLELFLIALL